MLLLANKTKSLLLLIFIPLLTAGVANVAFPMTTAYAERCENGMVVDSCSSVGSQPISEENDFQGDCTNPNISENNCGIVRYLVVIINALSALVGVAVVASIIVGGIQYSAAGSDPQKVQAAKNRIRNAIIALLFFLFGYGFLNFLIPGGLL